MRPIKPLVWSMSVLAMLSACAERGSDDFCEAHTDDHWRHAAAAAQLSLRYNGDGEITAELEVPAAALAPVSGTGTADGVDRGAGGVYSRILQSPAEVFVIQNAETCEGEVTDSQMRGSSHEVRYRLDCGAGFKLEKLSVTLLEHLAALDEVAVSVATPAVSKHFLVHRRCERALFNVKQNSESI